ncbi:Rv1733c family protein [Streptomyces argenteolus]|uniref:Rv1733c family protein n=1 Tax=Streptomyces sp. NPDC025273 TaxID=3155251 RepID=UPI0033E2E301
MRAVLGIRRWRHNPLCRPTDRHEAWVALVALLSMVLAAPALGLLCGALTDDALQRAVRAQHTQRRPTAAVVVREPLGSSRFAQDPESAVAEGTARTSVVARWTAPDGTVRAGRVVTASRTTTPGARIRIWTDDAGRAAQRPMDASTARTHAVLAGIGVTLLAAGLMETARRLVVRHMMQRRYIRLDMAWAETGPDWGRTGTGS